MWKAYPRHSVNLSAGCYSAVLNALIRGRVLQGPEVEVFEKGFADYLGVRHALGVSSGRAALYLAFKALQFCEGDEIIMPAYTFHIVPLVIKACGLNPVFVDVLPDTYNVDVALMEKKITPRTRAILATHMYGQPCDMEPVLQLARENDLRVLEDCAHALGASYKGRKVGSLGDLGAFTFAMAKNMPCFGGGMLTTNDDDTYRRLVHMVRPPGADRLKGLWKEIVTTTVNYLVTLPRIFSLGVYPFIRASMALGSSFFDREPGQERVAPTSEQSEYLTRLTNLQAAVGLHQLTRVEAINARMNRNALLYNELFEGQPGIKIPGVSSERTHTFLYYRIEVPDRQAFRKILIRKGVDTMPDDMSNCAQLPPFREDKTRLRVTPGLPERILEIPNNSHLKEKDVHHIAKGVKSALDSCQRS
ncbi:MAG: DegT/DnrJ/EryC1/StrS family aminotransferase [Desulfobacteraceae bacterium]|nr:DegT/DnrJ/EryC1/StrS family aminotransferase [Desulfobacteraceae bacterium]